MSDAPRSVWGYRFGTFEIEPRAAELRRGWIRHDSRTNRFVRLRRGSKQVANGSPETNFEIDVTMLNVDPRI